MALSNNIGFCALREAVARAQLSCPDTSTKGRSRSRAREY
jgi:hypothetical protein